MHHQTHTWNFHPMQRNAQESGFGGYGESPTCQYPCSAHSWGFLRSHLFPHPLIFQRVGRTFFPKHTGHLKYCEHSGLLLSQVLNSMSCNLDKYLNLKTYNFSSHLDAETGLLPEPLLGTRTHTVTGCHKDRNENRSAWSREVRLHLSPSARKDSSLTKISELVRCFQILYKLFALPCKPPSPLLLPPPFKAQYGARSLSLYWKRPQPGL